MKQIPGFPNYMVTMDGRVWSKRRKCTKGGWLKLNIDTHGYLRVELGRGHKWCIHHIVLKTYVGPCPDGMECRHLNGNQTDNRLVNLCWGSRSDNAKDAVRHGTSAGLKVYGENNGQSKLIEEQVRVIFHAYHDDTHTQLELADHFGVTSQCISRIVNKVAWRHLWDD